MIDFEARNRDTLEEIKERLTHLTYKPGWKFSISDEPYRPMLRIEFEAEDTYGSGRRIKVGMRTALRPMEYYAINIKAFDHWLLREIEKAECHEAREWLKFDGRMPFDPHRRDQP